MLSDLEIWHTSEQDSLHNSVRQEICCKETGKNKCHKEVLPGGKSVHTCLITLVHVYLGGDIEHFLHVIFSHEMKKVNLHSRVQTSWRPCYASEDQC